MSRDYVPAWEVQLSKSVLWKVGGVPTNFEGGTQNRVAKAG